MSVDAQSSYFFTESMFMCSLFAMVTLQSHAKKFSNFTKSSAPNNGVSDLLATSELTLQMSLLRQCIHKKRQSRLHWQQLNSSPALNLLRKLRGQSLWLDRIEQENLHENKRAKHCQTYYVASANYLETICNKYFDASLYQSVNICIRKFVSETLNTFTL